MITKTIKANHKKAGFTLIELLVVIAVIGLLSSIVLVSTKSAQKKAEMAKRLQFWANVQHALRADTLGWWSMDNGVQGGIVKDDSGQNNNAIVSGFQTEVNNCLNKKCLVNLEPPAWGELRVSNGMQISSKSGSVTMALWFYVKQSFKQTADTLYFFDRQDLLYSASYNPSSEQFDFLVRPSGFPQCSISATKLAKTDEWNYAVFSYNGQTGEIKIYLNSEIIEKEFCPPAPIYYNMSNGLDMITCPSCGPIVRSGGLFVDEIEVYDAPLP